MNSKRYFGIGLVSLMVVILSGCPSPTDPTDEQSKLTLNWAVQSERSIYPASYPTPVTFDVLLQSAGYANVTATGLTGSTWSISEIARVPWTITVTGNDINGDPIVQGGSVVDLTTVASQSATVSLQYLSTGSGKGTIQITLDLSEAPTTVTQVTLSLTDPAGVTTSPPVTLSAPGTEATFIDMAANVGSYYAYFYVRTTDTTAGKMENIVVFQNVDTTATLKFNGGDFYVPFRAATGVTLDKQSLDLYINGAPGTLTASLQPANASNQIISFTSSHPAIASVNSTTGTVTPLSVGTTTITATTAEGSFTATCDVTVAFKHVSSVSISPVNLTLNQGGAAGTLSATLVPPDASDTSRSWSSNNTAVATVDASGVVTPVAGGTATITVTTTDGSKTGTATVTVIPNGQSTGQFSTLDPPVLETVSITGSQYMPISGTNPTYTGTFTGTASAYQWFIDGTLIAGATGSSFTPSTQVLGAHILTLSVRNQAGMIYTGSYTVQVVENPPVLNDILSFSFPALGVNATISGTTITLHQYPMERT